VGLILNAQFINQSILGAISDSLNRVTAVIISAAHIRHNVYYARLLKLFCHIYTVPSLENPALNNKCCREGENFYRFAKEKDRAG